MSFPLKAFTVNAIKENKRNVLFVVIFVQLNHCFFYFLFSKENLRSFVGPGFEDLNGMDDRKTSVLSGDDYFGEKRFLCLSLDFSKIWKVLDEPHSSKCARVCSNV